MKSPVELLRAVDRALFPDLVLRGLAGALAGCSSVLDVGCGVGGPFARLPMIPRLVGVDGHAPSLEKLRALGRYAELVHRPLMEAEFPPRSFDAVVSLDVIEHFEMEEALRLVARMEAWASRRVVLHTPNGFLPQPVYDGNPYQVHRCGFTVRRLEGMGYRVHGTGGPRFLRKEFSELRFRPGFLWHRVSGALQPLTWRVPSWSFGLLAVKEV